jgi:hypothetical protein
MGETIGEYMMLVGKPEGKRPLRRPRRSLEDNSLSYKKFIASSKSSSLKWAL